MYYTSLSQLYGRLSITLYICVVAVFGDILMWNFSHIVDMESLFYVTSLVGKNVTPTWQGCELENHNILLFTWL